MLRDVTNRCRVPTQPLVVKNRKPLHGWFAAAVLLAGALASSGAIAANGDRTRVSPDTRLSIGRDRRPEETDAQCGDERQVPFHRWPLTSAHHPSRSQSRP